MIDIVEQAAQELIVYNATGSPTSGFEYPDNWDDLTETERAEAMEIFNTNTSDCEGCGWTFENESLESHDGELYCWRCIDDVFEESEDE